MTDTGSIADVAITYCLGHLADFKVPRSVYVVEALPEAMLGKVSKAILREWALEREPVR